MKKFCIICTVLFCTACAGMRDQADAPAGRVEITITEEAPQQRWKSLNAFSAVSALYRGLFCRFHLVDSLSLQDKWKIIEAVYTVTPPIAGPEPEKRLVEMRITGFYESGDPLIVAAGWFTGGLERVEWISNCIHSPLVNGPLLGRGAFIGNQGELYNYDDALYIHGGRVVRAADLNLPEELDLSADASPGIAVVMMGQALLYGGRSPEEHRETEKELFALAGLWPKRRDDAVFAAVLVTAEWEMASGRYGEAEEVLERLLRYLSAGEEARRNLVGSEKEILALTRRLAEAGLR
jgi:hypothetical protein